MSEYYVGLVAFISLLFCACGCYVYMLGGRQGSSKIVRRFGASVIICLGINVGSLMLHVWAWWLVLVYPILILAFSMGYGADTVWQKIVRRFVYTLPFMLVGVMYLIATHSVHVFVLLCVQFLVGLSTVILGVFNPIPAAAEETFVCFLLTAPLFMYQFALI